MKMVKSLLLGTAAGLVAVAGAQAADMPVKAAPVQYVKICSLYGDGFYYIPGTDICLIQFAGFTVGIKRPVRAARTVVIEIFTTNVSADLALAGSAKPTAIYHIQDQDNYGLRIRVHRDIVP